MNWCGLEASIWRRQSVTEPSDQDRKPAGYKLPSPNAYGRRKNPAIISASWPQVTLFVTVWRVVDNALIRAAEKAMSARLVYVCVITDGYGTSVFHLDIYNASRKRKHASEFELIF